MVAATFLRDLLLLFVLPFPFFLASDLLADVIVYSSVADPLHDTQRKLCQQLEEFSEAFDAWDTTRRTATP